MKRPGYGALWMLMLLAAEAGAASGDSVSMNINITAMVMASGACTFNQGGSVTVPFGDVRYTTLSGSNQLNGSYRQKLVSAMSCSGDTSGNAQMKLDTLTGSTVSYQGAALLPVMQSSVQSPSLAIRLRVNSTIQNVGQWFRVDLQNPPALEAELVQTGSGADFVSGATFAAAATLTMAFN